MRNTDVNKSKTSHIDNKNKKSKISVDPKRLIFLIIVSVFVIYFVGVMISQQIVINKKNKEIDALEEKISATALQTEKLEQELENLNDPEYLEQVAREKLGLVRPNERVFIDANKSESNLSD